MDGVLETPGDASSRERGRTLLAPQAPGGVPIRGQENLMRPSPTPATIALPLFLLIPACREPEQGDDHNSAGMPGSVAVEPITFDCVYIINGGDSSISVLDAHTLEVVPEPVNLFETRVFEV